MIDLLGGQPVAFARVRAEIAPWPIAGPPAAIAAALRGLAAEGVAEAQVYLPTCTSEQVEAPGPVLRALD